MAADINASIVELSVSIDANTTALGLAMAAFNSGVTSIVHGLASIDCSGCPPNGTYPPTGGIVEDDPPPTGFEEYDPVIDDRKCKLANMYFDDLREVAEFLRVNGFDDIGAIAIGSMAALLGVILGMLASGPIAWGLGALGALAGLIAFFLLESVDLQALIAIMDATQDDLVCSLYEATTPEGGKAAFKAVLSTGGATAGQLAFIDAVNMVVALEVLFFKPDGAEGDNIEARLDGYVATIDCVACVQPDACDLGFVLAFFDSSQMGSGDLTKDGSSRVLTSIQHPENGYWYISVKVGLPETTGSGDPNCDYIPESCEGTDEERFIIEFTDISEGVTSTKGVRCVDGVRTVDWNNNTNPPFDDPRMISWFECINYVNSFTLTCMISDVPV